MACSDLVFYTHFYQITLDSGYCAANKDFANDQP